MILSPVSSFGGDFRLTILRADRSVKFETDWMIPNLVTNGGLDRAGGGSAIGQYCRIGTGTTTATNADADLVSQSASTASTVAFTRVNNGSPNYETVATETYEFALGAVVGNMAEIGVGWTPTGATLFSRALIVDGGGSPTTITVLSSEILQVTYRLTIYPNLSDSTGTVDISGTSYGFTSRVFSAGSVLGINPTGGILSTVSSAGAYSGSIGAVTASGPSGTTASLTPGSLLTYTNGTYYRDYSVSAGISFGNVSGGIKSIIVILGNGAGIFNTQIEFSSAIPKDNTKQFSLNLRQAWSRH